MPDIETTGEEGAGAPAETPAETVTERDAKGTPLLVATGTQVNLQHTTSNTRVVGTVLGTVSGEYIVLRDPMAGGHTGLRSLNARVGETLIARLFVDGVAVGFRARVLRFTAEPEFLLFLSYPSEVEQVSVRKSPRIGCSLPCRFTAREEPQPGLLVDISALGCSLLGRPWAEGAAPAVDEGLELNLWLPEKSGPTRLGSTVRRVRAGDSVWRAGLAFDEPQDALIEQLGPYLLLAQPS